ncbi:MAG: hypothetical protein ACE5H1_07520 [Thermodesulfobacteriota bacterium]
MSSYSRQQLEAWMKTIDVKADKVLDVGGAQKEILSRTKTWHVGEYKVLDLEEPHEMGRKADIICDLNERKDFNEQYRSHFDIAFCLEVSEYWWNPLQALENIKSLLVVGGTLYISFHLIYPLHNPKDEDCLRYTESGAVKLLSKAGFNVKDIKYRTTQNASIEAFYGAEGMRPAKDYKRHDVIGFLITATRDR